MLKRVYIAPKVAVMVDENEYEAECAKYPKLNLPHIHSRGSLDERLATIGKSHEDFLRDLEQSSKSLEQRLAEMR